MQANQFFIWGGCLFFVSHVLVRESILCVFAYMLSTHTYMYVWLCTYVYMGCIYTFDTAKTRWWLLWEEGDEGRQKNRKRNYVTYRLAYWGTVHTVSSWFDQKVAIPVGHIRGCTDRVHHRNPARYWRWLALAPLLVLKHMHAPTLLESLLSLSWLLLLFGPWSSGVPRWKHKCSDGMLLGWKVPSMPKIEV